jgi:hypothetical protein
MGDKEVRSGAENEFVISVELGGHIYSHGEEKTINVSELVESASGGRRSAT